MSDSWSQATHVWHLYSDALAGLQHHLNEQVWQDLLTELRSCKGKIVVTGVGTSGIAARKVAHMLACVERPAIYLNATDAAHGDLGFLDTGDLVIMLSRGGNSDELTRLLPGLAARKVPILSVTENANSAIASASRLVISTGVQREADPLNMLATTSIILVLAIFDAACACLMSESGYSKETLLAVHPGGDVGLTLSQKQKV
ncbi:SIS domain-containing protein [Citrobacter freundii]|uniref:KpsF/GutQ family sugar-phosphate isomerase n=1 Tax=unclassified Citrobacter TaxID=2644389 RepID=UPI0005EE7CCE|nr:MULTISPECIES: SIS domain-containing protein [Citrobacter]MBJ9597685.1 SIS domain-containing protein [Citrobacter werkmanii]MBJ9871769.1 SIS domain-containing protein [Citrobacter werkmanii]MDK2358005.1 SIS domain-containing protein [Citrobacter freundii]MDM2928445.1 SIS domain-containing protein [Citrobacter sp. Cm046]HAU4329800.1 SIS domain-containing protein [Citrobacter freundii]